MKEAHKHFSQKMQDFLKRLGLSEGNAPGSWSVIWVLSEASKVPHFRWLHPISYQAIKTEIRSMQFLSIGALIAAAIYLRPEHGIEIEDTPINLAAYVHGEKKLFYGFRKDKNVLYYAVTIPLLIKQHESLLAVLKARDVLDRLVKGKQKSDYRPYIPESNIVEFATEKLGMQSVHCRHKEYYYGDQRFRYVSIQGQLLEPWLSVRVYLFDRQESIDWLQSHAGHIPETERTEFQRITYRVQGRKVLVFIEDLTIVDGVKPEYDIESYLADLSENLQGLEFDLSHISLATIHKTDPDFLWKTMLGRL